jgi:hypothetical protein
MKKQQYKAIRAIRFCEQIAAAHRTVARGGWSRAPGLRIPRTVGAHCLRHFGDLSALGPRARAVPLLIFFICSLATAPR